jgi:uncharacterized protein DUF5916
MIPCRRSFSFLNALVVCALSGPARAQDAPAPETLHMQRAQGAITVDGALDDPGWQGVPAVDVWYETNPGDNTPPKVKNAGYLAYDDKFLYAGFVFEDADPRSIRAPYGDRDSIGSSLDYGGVILDTRNTRRTAILFLANPRGIQYDAVTDDASGEDSSPDFYWDSAGRITDKGWTLEIRIPFSSLRYSKADPQTWGIMLYRNHPRDFRYQYFSTRLPKGGSCFICRSNALQGLQGLPSGGGIVLAPYATGTQQWEAPEDGGALERSPLDGTAGLDVKWRPGANTAVDGTINPDFSQIESDVALIAANERFALFFPEKRPFFLEGIEMFSTPIQAVYTRTITSPRWGLRSTGKMGAVIYTALFAEDRGGGSVILPGPDSSDLADQDFRSWVGMARLKRPFGGSFVSALAIDREIDGGGYNRVLGPDFQWRHGESDTVTGQLLFSQSHTPDRPDLADEWDGRHLADHAGQLWWQHSTRRVDWFTQYSDIGDEFRADSGFVPQVGYRQLYGEAGYTIRPQGAVRRQRFFSYIDHQDDQGGNLLQQFFALGTGLDAKLNSFLQLRYQYDKIRAGETVFPRHSGNAIVQFSPSRVINQINLETHFGQEIDFDNERLGHGLSLVLSANVRPTDHLSVSYNGSRRFLDVDDPQRGNSRLFTARVDRVRLTYTFTARSFVRLIGQWVETTRDPSLYVDEVTPRDKDFGGSALLAYKLNWQTVLFLGYGDNRALAEDTDDLRPTDRSLFIKLSYAFQR